MNPYTRWYLLKRKRARLAAANAQASSSNTTSGNATQV